MTSSQHTLESQVAEPPESEARTDRILEEELVDAEIVEEEDLPALDATAAGSRGQLYADQGEITAMARVVRTVAPWAKDPRFPLPNHEIGLAIRRSRALLVPRYKSLVQHLGYEHLPALRLAAEVGGVREGLAHAEVRESLLDAEAGVELGLGHGPVCNP